MDFKSVLTGHELFALLSPEEVTRVSNLSSEKRFRKEEIIYRKDTPTSHFFVVLEGEVRLRLPGTKDRLSYSVSKLHKGELFGLSPMLGFERYTVTAAAENEVTLLAIEAQPFLALLKTNPLVESAFRGAFLRAYYARYLSLLGTLQGVATQLIGG
jgi:signal-transduction protein with cAMP-binding, CBS, and nucleotidyltransferase domain